MPELEPTAEEVVRLLGALSDENRYRIVRFLAVSGESHSCGAIGGALGLSPSLLSHHLSILEGARVVERRKEGLWTLNRLRRDEISRNLDHLRVLLDGGPAGADGVGPLPLGASPS